jgi:hypothetical protein
MRKWFENFRLPCVKEKNNFKNFCLLLKTLSKAVSEFKFGFLLLLMVDFLQRMCHSRLSEQFSELQAAFGIIV